jgi:hypothetical protein
LTAKFTGHFSPIVPPFPARGLSRRCRRRGSWRYTRDLPKPGSYNKPQAALLPGALANGAQWKEEEKEEEEEEEKEEEEKKKNPSTAFICCTCIFTTVHFQSPTRPQRVK